MADPFDYDFKPAPCLPCCAPTPATASCAMFVGSSGPGNGTIFYTGGPFSPFSDYDSARVNVQDFDISLSGFITADCYAFCGRAGALPSATFSPTSNSFTLTITADIVQAFVCFTAKAGDTITVSDGLTMPWFCLDNTTMAGIAGGPGLDTFVIPADGSYLISLIYTSGPGARSATSTGDLVFNPVIGLWDDSGTTRQIEACPKLLLPPLTETSGDWYADATDAAAAIAEAYDCAAYLSPDTTATVSSFSAIDGGTSLSVNAQAGPGLFDVVVFWVAFSINDPSTDYVSIAISGPRGGSFINIYDDLGALVFSGSESSGSLFNGITNGNLPYPGRYTAKVVLQCYAAVTSMNATVAFTVVSKIAKAQALYDSGLPCPARLDCT